MIRDKKGYSTIELIMVVMILTVLCMGIFTMMFSGVQAFQTIDGQKESQIQARTALSYMRMTLRQNDQAERIRIGQFPDGTNALIISYPDENDEKWIYCFNGYLCYAFFYTDQTPDPSLNMPICPLESMALQWTDAGGIDVTVYYQYHGDPASLSETVIPRCRQGE